MVWKNQARFFHTVETFRTFFHTVETFCRCGRRHSLARRAGARRYRLRVRPAPIGLGSALSCFPHGGKLAEHVDGVVVRVAAVHHHGQAPLGREGQHLAEQRALGGSRFRGVVVVQTDLPHRHHGRMRRQRGQLLQVAGLVRSGRGRSPPPPPGLPDVPAPAGPRVRSTPPNCRRRTSAPPPPPPRATAPPRRTAPPRTRRNAHACRRASCRTPRQSA